MPKPKYVQLCNLITKRFVKIDSQRGRIMSHKKTKGPYKNIEILGHRYDLVKR